MSNLQHRRSGGTTLAVYIARFLAGRDLDGRRRTNATWWQHGDRDLTVHGRASRWAYRRHMERSAIRAGAASVALTLAWGLVWHRLATLVTLACVTLCGLVLAVWLAARTLRVARHNRRVVRPLFRTVAPHAYHGAGADHRTYLKVPHDYASNPKATVRLNLAQHWEGSAAQRKAITDIVKNRLGGDWTATFHQDVYPAHAIFRHMPEPPARVMLTDFIPVIDRLPDHVIGLGIGADASNITVDLDAEAPHIALSMGTGGGKTDTIALIVAQLRRKGCRNIYILDPKRVSHNWARGLDGVTIYRYVAGQMEAINKARATMDARYDDMDANPDTVFERIVLVIEEQNSLMQDLADYWDEYRRNLTSEERSQTPRTNPAIADLRYILNKGRQCRINVVSVYQRMSAAATGGGDARENYGCKILARYSPQTWKILVGTTPVPRPSRVPGRAMIVIGDEHRAVQRAYAGIAKSDGSADAEGIARLREFALNGAEDIPTGGGSPVTTVIGPAELITLREAAESNVIPIKYGALRKARQRDPEFPAGVPGTHGTEYDPSTLRAWHANRERAASTRREAV